MPRPDTRLPANPPRRALLAGATALALVAGLGPRGAWAMSTAQATTLVNALIIDINKVIAAGESEDRMIHDFEGIFDRYADVPAIARYALGADARRATRGQMARFTAAFRLYITRRYGRRFREFIGGRIEMTGTVPLPRGVQVKTNAILRGQAPFEVDFNVSDASGKVLFYNIIIEGVDMLLSERTEIGAMLDQRRGNIDRLITDLAHT